MTEEVKNYVRIHTRRGFEEDRRWKSGYTFKGIFDSQRILDVESSIWHEAVSVVEVPDGVVVKEYIRTYTLELTENPTWEAPPYRTNGYKFLGFKDGAEIFDVTGNCIHNPSNVKEV